MNEDSLTNEELLDEIDAAIGDIGATDVLPAARWVSFSAIPSANPLHRAYCKFTDMTPASRVAIVNGSLGDLIVPLFMCALIGRDDPPAFLTIRLNAFTDAVEAEDACELETDGSGLAAVYCEGQTGTVAWTMGETLREAIGRTIPFLHYPFPIGGEHDSSRRGTPALHIHFDLATLTKHAADADAAAILRPFGKWLEVASPRCLDIARALHLTLARPAADASLEITNRPAITAG